MSLHCKARATTTSAAAPNQRSSAGSAGSWHRRKKKPETDLRRSIGFCAALVFAVLLPFTCFNLPSSLRDASIIGYEFLAGAASVIMLARQWRRGSRHPDTLLLLIAVACLVSGGLFFSLALKGGLRASLPLQLIAFVSFMSFSCALLGALVHRYFYPLRKDVAFILSTVICFLFFAYLQVRFILAPLAKTPSAMYHVAWGCYCVYRICWAAIVGILLPCALRMRTTHDQLFAQSIVLIHTAGFAVSMKLSARAAGSGPDWAWIGWATGLGWLFLSLCRHEDSVATRRPLFSTWDSARTLLALLALLTSLVLLLAMTATRLLVIVPGSPMTTFLLLLFCCWALSSWLAFWVSEDLIGLYRLMPSGSNIEDVDADTKMVRLPTIGRRTIFAELNRVVERYNWLVSQANTLSAVVLTKNRDAALGELAAQVAHDIRSPLAALLMSVEETTNLEPETRLMIRSASQRIQDIANILLERRRRPDGHTDPETIALEPVLVANVVERVVSEKRS